MVIVESPSWEIVCSLKIFNYNNAILPRLLSLVSRINDVSSKQFNVECKITDAFVIFGQIK